MKCLLYLHGFLSSPFSFKAQQVNNFLAAHYPHIKFACPHLTPYPKQTAEELADILRQFADDEVGIIGSSLGGFWANYLAQTFNRKAVLINPAVAPQAFMPDYLNRPLTGYHTADIYRLTPNHIDEVITYDLPLTYPDNLWLLLQTGDETLDYRHALTKYNGSKITLEEGGDHSFVGFERYLLPSLEFLFADPSRNP